MQSLGKIFTHFQTVFLFADLGEISTFRRKLFRRVRDVVAASGDFGSTCWRSWRAASSAHVRERHLDWCYDLITIRTTWKDLHEVQYQHYSTLYQLSILVKMNACTCFVFYFCCILNHFEKDGVVKQWHCETTSRAKTQRWSKDTHHLCCNLPRAQGLFFKIFIAIS